MRKFSQLFVALVVAGACGLTFGFVSGKADPQLRHQNAVQRIEAQFQTEQERCQALPSDQLRLCLAVALSDKWRTLADEEVRVKDTPEARRSQRLAAAGGELLVALQKCGVLTSPERTLCRDSAKESFMREVSRVRLMEARDRPCSTTECAWLPHAPRGVKTTEL